MNKIILILILLMNCSTEREGDKKKRIQKECRNDIYLFLLLSFNTFDTVCTDATSQYRKNKTYDQCVNEGRQNNLIGGLSVFEDCVTQTSNDYKINPP